MGLLNFFHVLKLKAWQSDFRNFYSISLCAPAVRFSCIVKDTVGLTQTTSTRLMPKNCNRQLARFWAAATGLQLSSRFIRMRISLITLVHRLMHSSPKLGASRFHWLTLRRHMKLEATNTAIVKQKAGERCQFCRAALMRLFMCALHLLYSLFECIIHEFIPSLYRWSACK